MRAARLRSAGSTRSYGEASPKPRPRLLRHGRAQATAWAQACGQSGESWSVRYNGVHEGNTKADSIHPPGR